jgi:hypothetical protein
MNDTKSASLKNTGPPRLFVLSTDRSSQKLQPVAAMRRPSSRTNGRTFPTLTKEADFGADTMRRFNGCLFDEATANDLTADE